MSLCIHGLEDVTCVVCVKGARMIKDDSQQDATRRKPPRGCFGCGSGHERLEPFLLGIRFLHGRQFRDQKLLCPRCHAGTIGLMEMGMGTRRAVRAWARMQKNPHYDPAVSWAREQARRARQS